MNQHVPSAYVSQSYEATRPRGDALTEFEQGKVLEFLPIVKRIVTRIVERLPKHLDGDDLMHSGMLGLIDAVQRFQWGRERESEEFRAYADCRVRGRVMDELRNLDVLPRSTREKVNRYKKALEKLRQELRHDPTESELATVLEVDIEVVQQMRAEANMGQQIPLDNFQGGSGESLEGFLRKTIAGIDPNTPEALVHVEEVKKILAQAIDELSERERQVIALYYYDELTLKEIGMVLSVTESRISQIRSQALGRLMKRLKEAFDETTDIE